MSPAVFIDSAQYIAFLNEGDNLHRAAVDTAELLEGRPSVTSEAVLVEVLNFLGKFGPSYRRMAVALVETLRTEPSVTIAEHTTDLFAEGLELYRQRDDKSYGLTDCMSMVTCWKYGILEVATSDRDFAREGFTILLDV